MTGLTKKNKKSKTISKSKTKKTKNQSGGKKYKYKEMWCSQSIVNLPRMDCLNKNCFTKKYKDSEKKLLKLKKEYDAFVSKKCNIKFTKDYGYNELNPKTPEELECSNTQRKGKLFKNILKLEDEINFTPCEKKHCGKLDYISDCIDIGEEECRIKYKDVIENMRKTKKRTILPLEKCM